MSSSSLLSFHSDFGTHYMDSAVFGGLSFSYSRITSVTYESFKEQGFAFGTAATLAFMSVLGADVSQASGYASYQALNASNVDGKSFFFSSPIQPPVPTDVNNPSNSQNWQNLVDVDSPTGPSVISMTLVPLVALLTPENFPDDPNLQQKVAGIIQFLSSTYCSLLNPTPGCNYVNPNPLVAYFTTPRCPSGWAQHVPSAGRLIFAADNSPKFPSQLTVGDPLLNMQAPTHDHIFSYDGSLGLKGIDAARGGGFNMLGAGGISYTSNTTLEVTNIPPFIQLLTCSLPTLTPTPPTIYTLPGNATLFYDQPPGTPCPASTFVTPATAGYALVSGNVLDPSTPPLSFGLPLQHTHSISGEIDLPGIGTNFGCSGGGDGGASQNGFSFQVESSPSAPIPYTTLLTCTALPNITAVTTLPPGILLYSQTPDCSDLGSDWFPFEFSDGYFVVSTPPGGSTGTYGGAKLATADSQFSLNHTHFPFNTDVSDQGCVSFAVGGCLFILPCCEGWNGCGGVTGEAPFSPSTLGTFSETTRTSPLP